MQYDFTTNIDRLGQDATAFDSIKTPLEGYDIIPMWIADMNFVVPDFILEPVRRRLELKHFGYFSTRKEWFDAIIYFQKAYHGIEYKQEWIGYQDDVLGPIMSTLEAFTAPGDEVLMLNPRYTGYGLVPGYGRKAVFSELKKDEKGIWRIDFDDIEEKIKKQHIKLFLLCSPHNPCGRVWEYWELKTLVDICTRHGVIIVDDEIWADIILSDNKHIPLLAVEGASDITVQICSISKSFSLAALNCAYHIIPDPDLRAKMQAATNRPFYNHMGVLNQYALIGALSPEGVEWLKQLSVVLTGNAEYAVNRLREMFGCDVMMPQGTYMIYPDMSKWLDAHELTSEEFARRTTERGVTWLDGAGFGKEKTLRLNVALPRAKVEEAFDRVDKMMAETGLK